MKDMKKKEIQISRYMNNPIILCYRPVIYEQSNNPMLQTCDI